MSIAYRLGHCERLEVLAAAVLDYLDDTFTEAELDNDSGPPATVLYNLASALLDGARTDTPATLIADHDRHADEEASEALQRGIGGGPGRLYDVHKRILEELQQ
jgi:hypothetical protein